MRALSARAPGWSAGLLAAVLALCCGGEGEPGQPGGGGSGGAGGTAPLPDAGPDFGPCHPGELELDDGTCQSAGVPADQCGEGFEPDGADGCEPILPPEPCADGLMAIPGETECRPVAPCGAAPWGDIPVDSTTHYVDLTYAGGDSDGTAAKPWTTIQAGVDAVEAGGLVAVAAGSYAEDVRVEDKPVRLWGRCPTMVEVVAQGTLAGAIDLRPGADGSEVHQVGITGDYVGLAVDGVQDVWVDRVWIHGTDILGIMVQDFPSETSARVTGSLIEEVRGTSLFVWGSSLAMEETEVRETLPWSNLKRGRAFGVIADPDSGRRATLVLQRSRVVHNREFGVLIYGADGTVEDTYVGHTAPLELDQTYGRGLVVRGSTALGARGSLAVRRSVIADNHDAGIEARDSDLIIEHTVVRDIAPQQSDATWGLGIVAAPTPLLPAAPSQLDVRASLIDHCHTVGLLVAGTEATIESLRVRDIAAQLSDQRFGRGMDFSVDAHAGIRTQGTVRGCVVDRPTEMGVAGFDADVWVEGTAVRNVELGSDGLDGEGIVAITTGPSVAPASLTVRTSLVDGTHTACVALYGGHAVVEHSAFTDCLADGLELYGDGLFATAVDEDGQLIPAKMELDHCRVEAAVRAGISSFGATVGLTGTELICNPIALNGEVKSTLAATFEDGGDNLCRCGDDVQTCQVLSTGLSPPAPIDDVVQPPATP